MLLDKLEQYVLARQFDPRYIGLLINPFYFARKGLHQHITALAPQMHGRLLDVGCGSKPYRQYFDATEYVGMEIEGSKRDVDCHYDGKTFPFPDQSFDSVITSQVLEHVFNPQQFLSEINRVLKKDGRLLLTVPFVWDEHEQPNDYARYSSFGLQHLLQQQGFAITNHQKSIDDVRVIFQLINAYIFKKIVPEHVTRVRMLFAMLFTAPFNLLGTLLGAILPRNRDLYLDNIILARKLDAENTSCRPENQT